MILQFILSNIDIPMFYMGEVYGKDLKNFHKHMSSCYIHYKVNDDKISWEISEEGFNNFYE